MATPNLPSKRHISFYSNKEYTSVCRGINLKSRCTNPACESVRSMGGLVVVKCPDRDTCVYQEAAYDLPCPSCGTVLSPMQFSGVVFVRCEARVSIGDKSELIKASQEETVLYEMEYIGPEVRIKILEREPENPPPPAPSDISGNDLLPAKGLNLVGTCRFKDCLAFRNNQGRVIVKVGLIESGTFQELVKFRNCPSCNKGLDPDSFTAVIFLGCKAEVELGRNIERFDATSFPKPFQIDVEGPPALIRLNPDPNPTSSEIPAPVQLPPVFQHLVSSSPDEAKGKMKMKVKAMQNLLEIMPSLKGSKPSDYGFGHLGFGDLSLGDVNERLLNALQSDSSDEFDESSKTEMESGINFMADCPNSKCGSVVIPSGHIVSCRFKEAIRGMACPSCKQVLSPTNFTGVGFVLCKASVETSEKRFVYQAGQRPKIYKIHPEGLEVEITVLEREHKVATKPGKLSGRSRGKKYIKVCDGVNFEAFCQNRDCHAVKENLRFVNVNRDLRFIQKGGFPNNRCNYSVEVQNLQCPSCGERLDPEFVRGVALVRCKGTIMIGGESRSFEAKKNDLVKFELDHSDPRTYVEYEVVSLLLHGPGLNILFRCPNNSCPGKDRSLFKEVVSLKFGVVTGFKVNEELLKVKNCPVCKHQITIQNIISLLFNECTAVVRTKGKETHYLIGSRVESIRFELSDNNEVDILPIIARDVTVMMRDKNPFITITVGLNVQAICSNQHCQAKQMYEGRVCISCPDKKNLELRQLYSTLLCPSCKNSLSSTAIVCLSFLGCKAFVKSGSKKFLIEAASDEVIDFERSSFSHDLSIKVLSLEEDFPESRERNISKGSEYSHASLCHGLNFRASCTNPNCLSEQSGQYVNIMSGHLLDFDYRLAVQSLTCPCCSILLPPEDIEGITMLCCTGEVKIGTRIVKFDYTVNRVSTIKIPKDASKVWIKVEHRTYDVITNPVFAYSLKPFQSLCKGVNFHCHCKNPSCNSFKERDGLVNVQRNAAFMQSHRCIPNVCSYRNEISNLKCPDCFKPLPRYFVWGILLNACSGTILRDGSPPEKFCTPSGNVVLYALDRDDASVCIEFSLI